MKRAFLSTIISILIWANFAQIVHAQNIPQFPTCSNPQGSTIASYASGQHGIVGQSSLVSGSDNVYKVTDNTVLQCFCPDSGDGIQTNWWKFADLTEEYIQDLKNQGWIFVADGSAWGLDPAAYLAQNMNYSCKGSSTSTGTGGGGSVLSQAASTTGSVLGFAGTGNSTNIYLLFAAGVSALLIGFSLARKK